VISSAATWPRRSRVACTLELKPLVNFVPAWAKLMPLRLDWSFDHPSIAVCLRLAVNWELVVVVEVEGALGAKPVLVVLVGALVGGGEGEEVGSAVVEDDKGYGRLFCLNWVSRSTAPRWGPCVTRFINSSG
jgi:hypothetical protein